MDTQVASIVALPLPAALGHVPAGAPVIVQRLQNAAGATATVTTVAIPPGMYVTIDNGASDIRVIPRIDSSTGAVALTSYRIAANQFRSFRNTSGVPLFFEVRQDGTAAYECFVWGSSP